MQARVNWKTKYCVNHSNSLKTQSLDIFMLIYAYDAIDTYLAYLILIYKNKYNYKHMFAVFYFIFI